MDEPMKFCSFPWVMDVFPSELLRVTVFWRIIQSLDVLGNGAVTWASPLKDVGVLDGIRASKLVERAT